jgi:hypothetical protein
MSKCKNLFLLFTLFLFTGLSFNSYAGPVCGNNVVEPPEECDTGTGATSLCNNDTDPAGGNGPCMFTICGDSILQSPNGVGFNEQCEPPSTATCDAICQTVGATTSTTGATTSTTTPTTSTTTAAATTTTTLPPNQSDDDNFDFGGGGCTISKTPTTGMDPIWLFLLLAPGLGILRRRVAATGASGTKSI